MFPLDGERGCVCPSCAPGLLVQCSGVYRNLHWFGWGWRGGYPLWDGTGLMGLDTIV